MDATPTQILLIVLTAITSLFTGILVVWFKGFRESIKAIWAKLDTQSVRIDRVRDEVNEHFVRKADLDTHFDSYNYRRSN